MSQSQYNSSNSLKNFFGEDWKLKTVMAFYRIHHQITIHTPCEDMDDELLKSLDALMCLAQDIEFEKR